MLSYLKPLSKPTTSLLLIWLMLGSLMLPMVGASSESGNEEIPSQFGDQVISLPNRMVMHIFSMTNKIQFIRHSAI